MNRSGFPTLDHEPKRGPPSYKSTLIMDTDTWSQVSTSSVGLGKRRNSWTNLVESDENLNKHKVNVYPKVSAPFKQPSLSSASSIASADFMHTTDVFRHYVPRGSLPVLADPATLNVRPAGTLSNSRAPSKAPSVAMSPMPHSALDLPPKTSPVKKNRLQEWKKMCCTPCVFLILLALLILGIIAAIIAIVLTQVLKTPKDVSMTWLPPEGIRGPQNQSSNIRMTAEGDRIKMQLQGALPFKGNYISYYDFPTNKVIVLDESLKGNGRNLACFVLNLDRNNLQGPTEIRKAANAGKKKDIMTSGWQESWMFMPNPMSTPPQLSVPIKECEGARWIQLDPTSMDQKTRKCSDCYDFCLPEYGIERSGGDEYLNIVKRDCFYLFVPEWRSYAQANSIEQNQRDFEQYYRNRVHLNPSYGGPNGESKWISLSVPQGMDNAANVTAQALGNIGGRIQNTVQGVSTAIFGGNGQPGLYGSMVNGMRQAYPNQQSGVPNQEVSGIVNLNGVNGNNGNNMYQMGAVGNYGATNGNMNGIMQASGSPHPQPYGQPSQAIQQNGNGYEYPNQATNDQAAQTQSQYTPNVASISRPQEQQQVYSMTSNGNGLQTQPNTGLNVQPMTNGAVNSQNAQATYQSLQGAPAYSSDVVRSPPRYNGGYQPNVQQLPQQGNIQQPSSGYTPQVQGIAGMEVAAPPPNSVSSYTPDVVQTQPTGRWIRV